MLLNSVILILREVLEAAILVSVLLALSMNMRSTVRWFWWSVLLGILGSIAFAAGQDLITDALDGAGQEVLNASLQGFVYVIAVAIIWISANFRGLPKQERALKLAMAAAVVCAMIREGSEIYIYIYGFTASQDHRTAVLAGSAIGSGIGLSVGVLVFYALRGMQRDTAKLCCLSMVGLIAAGMISQSAFLLEQAGWLSTGQVLWDSSGVISEQSISGQLLYAVFGYESTPGTVQVSLYVISIVLAITAYTVSRKREYPVDAT
jgi:high-affinity iron transporter